MVSEKDFLAFAAGVMGVPPEDLALDVAYGSIPAWDSVMQLRLVLEIGARYGVELPLEVIPGLRTLAQFYNHVKDTP